VIIIPWSDEEAERLKKRRARSSGPRRYRSSPGRTGRPSRRPRPRRRPRARDGRPRTGGRPRSSTGPVTADPRTDPRPATGWRWPGTGSRRRCCPAATPSRRPRSATRRSASPGSGSEPGRRRRAGGQADPASPWPTSPRARYARI